MNVKQIRCHVAFLAVTVIAVLAVLFAMATVTSNADTSYDPETRTYTMTGGEYDQQIVLDHNMTTIVLSGYNKMTYGDGTYLHPCFKNYGKLTITGNGTLEIPNGEINCSSITISDGAKLKLGNQMIVFGSITVDNAEIEACSPSGHIHCSDSSGKSRIICNNASIKVDMFVDEVESVFNDCNFTLDNTQFRSFGALCTINGGTYNFTQDYSDPDSYKAPMIIGHRAVIKNAVIKSNSPCSFENLEMTDSTVEITIPPMPESANYGAPVGLDGGNLVFTNSKINVDGSGYAGSSFR